MKCRISLFLAPLVAFAATLPARAADADPKLAQQAYNLVKKYCYRCHGVEFNGSPAFNVLDRDILTAPRGDRAKPKNPYISPGKPDESLVWKRIDKKQMPPEEEPQPTDDEKVVIKKWIDEGALFPAREQRPFISEQSILTSILNHQRGVQPPEDRKYYRYFTITHLFNNNKEVTEYDLRLYRAAMSKVANSLSWEPDIALPKAVDKEGTVFTVDLRWYGWDKQQLWTEILRQYPYGLRYNTHPDVGFRSLALEVYQMTGSSLPYVRADWFIAYATRPPLYHTMLGIPKNAKVLEEKLHVDFKRNFTNNRLARAGFATSGISRQNRLVERHPASYGAYWKSYDFGPGKDKASLTQFPLGPCFDENPFDKQAFEHDGGEIIFNLPNGLQGYMLVNSKDDRIDEGPIAIVNDSLKTSGTPAIVTGLSCIACHRHGMIADFKDTVREARGLAGDPALKVDQLYPKAEEMDKYVRKDYDKFMRALDEAVGPFLKVGDDQGKDLASFPEPVGAIARLYLKDLTAVETALELGIDKPEKLQGAIGANPELRRLGLGPLMQGATINRERWDSKRGLVSPFQKCARELEIGSPFNEL